MVEMFYNFEKGIAKQIRFRLKVTESTRDQEKSSTSLVIEQRRHT